MKKNIFFAFISFFGLLFSNLGFANWVIESPIEITENIGMKSPGGIIECYKVSGGTEESSAYAKFATLEGAVASANSVSGNGGGVNIYLTTNSYIDVSDQNLTLNSGVSLYLPYSGKLCDISSDDEIAGLGKSFVDTDASGVKKYNVSNLAFKNSTLNISSGARVVIGGIFQETGVSGSYSQITLDEDSSITVGGELICNGYIKEENPKNLEQQECSSYLASDSVNNDCDKNRYVLVKSGGSLKAPIAFYDAGGTMGALTGLNSAGVFPVNVFDFPCLQTYVRIDAGGKFLATGRMVRSSGGITVPVNETIQVIKASTDSSNALITLNSGYVSFEYCPLNPGFTQKDRSKTYLVINGEASLGYMSISVQGTSISTANKFLPFSYKLRVYIGSKGSFSTNSYKIKFLPGGQLKILKGGKLNLSSSLVTYKSNSLSSLSTSYPTDFSDASIVCNGTFIMNSGSTMGAHFSTESSDGTATINLSAVTQASLNASSPESMNATQISIYSTGDFIDDDGTTISKLLLKAGGEIKSDSQGNHYWQSAGSMVSYTLSIVVSNPNNYKHPVAGYQVYKYDSSGTETMLSTKDLFESESKSYILGKGESFKVISLDRADSTAFSKQANTEYAFTSGNTYAIKGDTEITISSGEGILVRCEVSNGSGAGGASHKIYEKTSGSYNLIGEFAGPTTFKEVAIKKGATVKYWVKLGSQNFLNYTTDNHYLLNGIVDKTSALSKSALGGTQLTTKSENSGKYSEVANVQSEITIHQLIIYDSGGGCFAKGTRILTADGSYKAIEELNYEDRILTWDFFSGSYTDKGIAILVDHGEEEYDVLNLDFSNGTSLRVIGDHGIFDYDLNEFIYINPTNYNEFIGHHFAAYDNGKTEVITLNEAIVSRERTHAYSITSESNYNAIADGLLTSPPPGDFYNWIPMAGKMRFDVEEFNNDVEKYGLYDYSEFEQYGISYETFLAFNGQYLRIPVEKGIFSFEYIIELFDTYKDWL